MLISNRLKNLQKSSLKKMCRLKTFALSTWRNISIFYPNFYMNLFNRSKLAAILRLLIPTLISDQQFSCRFFLLNMKPQTEYRYRVPVTFSTVCLYIKQQPFKGILTNASVYRNIWLNSSFPFIIYLADFTTCFRIPCVQGKSVPLRTYSIKICVFVLERV